MKRVILSFDYEIYFDGKNNYETLLQNTERILEIASRHQVQLVFFIDIAYLVKLESSGQDNAFISIKNQILKMLDDGHELQYHYHPHWINAEYLADTNSWKFDKTEYSFSNMVDKYGIEKSKEDFTSVYKFFRNLTNRDSIAFRAGGLAINNYQSEFIGLLLENGFKFDSSLMPGLKMKGMYLFIDHSMIQKKETWKISPEQGFFSESENKKYELTEIPILTIDKSKIDVFSRIVTSLRYRLFHFLSPKRKQYLGGTFDHGITESVFPTSITFDGSGKADIIIMKHFTRAAFRQGKQLLCLLSHPKSFQMESFTLFENYIRWLKSKATLRIIGFKDLN